LQNNTIFGHYKPLHTIVLNKTTSTNDYLKHLLSNFKPLPEFTAIMAKMQTHGRGQRGSSWITEPGQNLTASVYLKLNKLDTSKQFLLTATSSLALYDTIRHYVNKNVAIKWPNDIFIDNKKVCGLLIENKISGSQLTTATIGIGLNINQIVFPEDIKEKATSLRLAGLEGSISFIEIIQTIQRYLYHYHQLLTRGSHDELLKQYNERLFQKDEIKIYRTKDQPFYGKIIGVEEDGLLQIIVDGQLTKYDLKDITYQL